ncbi:hypothetical protein MNBD_PLANCTO02-749, partial [hydrothermal vent metagenome]
MLGKGRQLKSSLQNDSKKFCRHTADAAGLR